MDLAFSRDQTNKVYVQHKMLEAAQELWRWLANGAYLYGCGDAQRMAGGVDLALQQIAITHGGMDRAAPQRFLAGPWKARCHPPAGFPGPLRRGRQEAALA